MRPRTALLLALGACIAFPAGASAETLPTFEETADTWTSCNAPVIENPFLFDGDALDYVLAPSGSFEGAATGWQFSGGAVPVAGNDPFGLRPLADDQVLSMPAGSSAISPLMCVDLTFPTFRFAARELPGHSKLKVEAIYPDAPKAKFRRVAKLKLLDGGGWVLTDHIALEPERGGAIAGDRRMALRFTVVGDDEGELESSSASFEIDDIYVDPRIRN